MQPASLVFDLDGTLVDTESVEYAALREVWRSHGLDYPLERWAEVVGRSWAPDWLDELDEALGSTLDRGAVLQVHRRAKQRLLADLRPRPGAGELLRSALARGIPVGVASNSPAAWVERRLADLDLLDAVDVVVTIDTASAPKPDPAPFLEACAALGADPSDSVAIEDSVTGVAAAVGAGLLTVACPNPLTAGHDLSAAHLVVASLAEVSLERLGGLLATRRADRLAGSAP